MDPEDSDKDEREQAGDGSKSFKAKLGFFFGYNG